MTLDSLDATLDLQLEVDTSYAVVVGHVFDMAEEFAVVARRSIPSPGSPTAHAASIRRIRSLYVAVGLAFTTQLDEGVGKPLVYPETCARIYRNLVANVADRWERPVESVLAKEWARTESKSILLVAREFKAIGFQDGRIVSRIMDELMSLVAESTPASAFYVLTVEFYHSIGGLKFRLGT